MLRLAPRAMRRGFFLAVRWRIRWEPVQPTVLSRAVGVFPPQSDGPTQRIIEPRSSTRNGASPSAEAEQGGSKRG